jgi:hypothetical protein
MFYFPWRYFSRANGEPHHSGFKFQIVALSLLCAMLLAGLLFVDTLLNVVLVLFPDILVL